MAKRLKPHEMTDEQFERWLKRNGITGMAAVNASMSRRMTIKYYKDREDHGQD
jgi:hypothetical protein